LIGRDMQLIGHERYRHRGHGHLGLGPDALISRVAMLQRAPLGDPGHLAPRAFDASNMDPKKLAKLMDGRPRIRCPICVWEPKKRDKWACAAMGAPEHFAGGCGKVWHTFDTRGRCPGCTHQWQHTTCLRCNATSVHEDWYEKKNIRQ
jgi:hypothetical protein